MIKNSKKLTAILICLIFSSTSLVFGDRTSSGRSTPANSRQVQINVSSLTNGTPSKTLSGSTHITATYQNQSSNASQIHNFIIERKIEKSGNEKNFRITAEVSRSDVQIIPPTYRDPDTVFQYSASTYTMKPKSTTIYESHGKSGPYNRVGFGIYSYASNPDFSSGTDRQLMTPARASFFEASKTKTDKSLRDDNELGKPASNAFIVPEIVINPLIKDELSKISAIAGLGAKLNESQIKALSNNIDPGKIDPGGCDKDNQGSKSTDKPGQPGTNVSVDKNGKVVSHDSDSQSSMDVPRRDFDNGRGTIFISDNGLVNMGDGGDPKLEGPRGNKTGQNVNAKTTVLYEQNDSKNAVRLTNPLDKPKSDKKFDKTTDRQLAELANKAFVSSGVQYEIYSAAFNELHDGVTDGSHVVELKDPWQKEDSELPPDLKKKESKSTPNDATGAGMGNPLMRPVEPGGAGGNNPIANPNPVTDGGFGNPIANPNPVTDGGFGNPLANPNPASGVGEGNPVSKTSFMNAQLSLNSQNTVSQYSIVKP